MKLKKLPIGLQSFREIITKDFIYVDKTEGIARLLEVGKYFFLARPRRFGKSLLLSTIKEVFLGSKELFEGFWIYDKWDWNQKHPIVHIGFSSMGYKSIGLVEAISAELNRIAESYEIEIEGKGHDIIFRELLSKLHVKYGQVVLLIDEYDKPLIDYLGKNIEQALEHQGILKSFYSVLKDADASIRFLLITGVSKFSKVSLFSELNNLYDLTFNKDIAGLLGISEPEIRKYFSEYMALAADELKLSIEELYEKLRYWYNGYSWEGETFVYNPFSLLCFLFGRDFRNYWFETGTPTFLLEMMKRENFYRFDKFKANESSFAAYDIERLRLLPLLFQTGYLTIKSKKDYRYVLDYPNREVRESMYQYIMGDLMYDDPAFTTNSILDLREALFDKDIEEAVAVINGIFARIPYEIFIANQEAYYHSLLHVTFQFLGNYLEAEVSTNRGRIDIVIHTPTDIYIIEFKLDQPAQVAIDQIHERKYYEKYLGNGKAIQLLGISFSSKTKSVAEWILEEVEL